MAEKTEQELKEMIDAQGIEKVIPHRGDMRMIDEIREYDDHHGVGVHYVRDNEFWCAGHFPGDPIMPGVLQIEALAQTACFIVMARQGYNDGKSVGYFTTMERIKFTHMVRPGDVLELHVELLMQKLSLHKFHGTAYVDGIPVADAIFTAILRHTDE